jgi:hypothetical protein
MTLKNAVLGPVRLVAPRSLGAWVCMRRGGSDNLIGRRGLVITSERG